MPDTEKSCVFLLETLFLQTYRGMPSSSLYLFFYLNKYVLFANYTQGSMDKTEPPLGPHGVYVPLDPQHPPSAVCPRL